MRLDRFTAAVVFRRRHHNQNAVHLVVAQAAEFSAGDFVLTRAVGMNIEQNHHARHNVLFGSEFPHEKIVDHIPRMQQQANIASGGNAQCGSDDIVFSVGIGRIDANGIPTRVGDKLRADPAKYAIWAGITEIPCELMRVDFDDFRISRAC